MSNRIRILTPSDVPQAFGLSQSAGWNQTTGDWSLALEMNPAGCFAIEVDGAVMATTTSIRYGTDLARIGMVLTHPEMRDRGFARALMERTLDHLSDVRTVKLDATEMGMPLYHRLGFRDECAIERWVRLPQPADAVTAGEFAEQTALDRRGFGADRTGLLQRLARFEVASVPGGFAMGRPNLEMARFGPCVASDISAALTLARWFVGRHQAEKILWDLLPANPSAGEMAAMLGFALSRQLTRMARGAELRTDPELIYACAGFEFG